MYCTYMDPVSTLPAKIVLKMARKDRVQSIQTPQSNDCTFNTSEVFNSQKEFRPHNQMTVHFISLKFFTHKREG